MEIPGQLSVQIEVVMKGTKEWFATWFDTTEYHTLYGHRDSIEAEDFIKTLIEKFELKPPCQILDAGCGAGRHVHSWAKHGFEATGFDLSTNSIEIARDKAEISNLHKAQFEVHDLRKLHEIADWQGRFNILTNLFTSFGYFPVESDHKDVVKGFSHSLENGGMLILDYINSTYSAKRIVPSEVQTKDNITFNIKREIKDGFFTKTISYCLPGKPSQTHTELVKAWSPEELIALLSSVGLQVKFIYGDYQLNNYHEDSPRMILIAEKN